MFEFKRKRKVCMVKPRIIATGAILMLCVAFCFGQDSTGFKISLKGQAWAEGGQVVRGYDKNVGDISHVYFQNIDLLPGLNIRLSDKTHFTGGMGVKAFNEFPRIVESGFTRRYYYYLWLDEAELSHRFFDKNNSLQMDVGGGYFQYKYNEDARNLGEYLFRSTAYPQTLTTDFDFPKARLAGLYSRNSYNISKSKFNLDVLAFTNTQWMAIGDLNLAAIASYNYAKIFEIGAGVMFGSVISADEKTTTPINDATRYIDGTDTSKYYTFRGTKVMGRVSFDVKHLLPVINVFGEEDLKIYGEAALLGVKNYDMALHSPVWYNSILERIPVMAGLNLPTFKILDVLSLEGEWWGNRYPNNMQGIVDNGLPLPFVQGTQSVDSTMYKNDNFKWSIYAKRIFATHYYVAAQAASDHMRTFAWDWNRQDWNESLRGTNKWYFVLKFGVLF